MTKKNLSSIGERAVSRFFSEDTHKTHTADKEYNTHKTQQKISNSENSKNALLENDDENNGKLKYVDKQRITLAFDEGLYDYLKVMIRFDGVNATKYINNLIEQDKQKRSDDYKMAFEIFKL
jgi:hypothetical protein